MKKRLILFLVLAGWLTAQNMQNERLYLDIDTEIADKLPGRNPAYIHSDNIPFDYAFTYQFRHDGGSDRLPYTPSVKAYQNLSATAYREMDNGMLFAGRFAYRYEQRKDKLFLHNAENYLDIPFYFGDSTAGDFRLNGIDWNVIFVYPLSSRLRVGLDIFYNVDEQMKTTFPKPSVKRNDVHVRPGISYRSKNFTAGLCASYFNYKEQMYTRKYILEQGRTPIFMRIRGLDKPVLSYAQTSEERLQSISGGGVSANIDLSGRLLLEGFVEKAAAGIADGGSYPVPQGNWELLRYFYRVELRSRSGLLRNGGLYFEQNSLISAGFHPTLNERIYASVVRSMEGGLILPYRRSSAESLTGTLSYLIEEYKREDNFFGLLHYIPSHVLQAEVCYVYRGTTAEFELDLQYSEDICIGDPVVYAGLTGEYYSAISEAELAWHLVDRRQLRADLQITFPFYGRKLAVKGSYTHVMPLDDDRRFHYAETGIAYIF
jgi:hypothetical protein